MAGEALLVDRLRINFKIGGDTRIFTDNLSWKTGESISKPTAIWNSLTAISHVNISPLESLLVF